MPAVEHGLLVGACLIAQFRPVPVKVKRLEAFKAQQESRLAQGMINIRIFHICAG